MSFRFRSAFLFAGVAAAFGLALAVNTASAQAPQAGPDTPAASAKSKAADASKTSDASAEKNDKEKAEQPRLETATFGGGCFWCLEAFFEQLKGVKSVVSGYAGGTTAKPSYEMVCTGLTGHAEVVEITYDPSVITYDDLLEIFWLCHNPTTLNAQGPDHGTQYRSIILYHDDAQKAAAKKSFERVSAAGYYRDPIVTQLEPLTKFYPAEKYHQDYYRRNKSADYCQMIITPKLRELKAKLNAKASTSAKKP